MKVTSGSLRAGIWLYHAVYDWLKKPVPCPARLHGFALYGGFAARRVRLCDLSPQGFGHIQGHIGGAE
jgi:hypothetical protein